MTWKDKIFANFGWKLAAVFLAMVLWFHVSTEETYEKHFPARIHPVGLNSRLAVERIEPPTGEIAIIGTGKQLLQLSLSGGVTAYFDLSPVRQPGEFDYELGLANLYDIDASEFRSVTIINGNHFKIAVKPRA